MNLYKDYVKLSEAWENLLCGIDWDLFCTFTYAASVWSTEKIVRDWSRVHRVTQAETWGCSVNNKKFRKAIRNEEASPYLLAIEPHKSGTLHAHVLSGQRSANGACKNTLDGRSLKINFEKLCTNAGFSSISPVRKNKRARTYVVKTSRYCSKNPDAYLDWYGLGDGIAAPSVGSCS